jgi:hypothetical protein
MSNRTTSMLIAWLAVVSSVSFAIVTRAALTPGTDPDRIAINVGIGTITALAALILATRR